MNRRLFARTGIGLAALTALQAAKADAYPSRPVHLYVPYAAGGGPDVQVRQASRKMAEALGQPVVIENKVGAGGVLGAQLAAKAAPDGYTVLVGSNTHLIQKIMSPELRFDPLGDFVPVSNLAASPTVLVVLEGSPIKSVQDLSAALRASAGKMNYASGGIGSSAHLAAATLVSLLGAQATHIPLKGSVEILASLVRGDVDFACPIAGTGVPLVKAGKLRALAVTSASRLKDWPEVPTLREALRSDLAVQESWFGFWAPLNTPAEAVNRLHAAVTAALQEPALRASFELAGSAAVPSDSPQAFAGFVRSEYRKWAEIVRLTGVRPV